MRAPVFAVTTPVPRETWHEVYTQDPTAVPYQSPDWFDCVCADENYADASRMYEDVRGRILIVPLVRKRGVLSEVRTAASLPNAWGMGGVISSHPLTSEDICAVTSDLANLSYVRTSIRPNPFFGELWARAKTAKMVATPRRAHILDLKDGYDEVLNNRFSKSTRKQIRRAERAGVIVERDTTGRLLPVFYDLYESSLARWAENQNEPEWLARWRASRRDPLKKLQSIAKFMGEACSVWVAWHEGRPAAASIMLHHHNVNDSRGAMDRELAAETHANSLLQAMSIEFACARGCRYFQMGESGKSESLAYYKERFGAEPFDYAEYHLERVPITRIDTLLRSGVKKMIGFKDA